MSEALMAVNVTKGGNVSKRVFISSTVFDLIDIRRELSELLREMGLRPVMSDISSNFTVLPDASSIETCLANVSDSDYFICLLSQRYGPRLGQVGYEDISATHLEYRRALEKQKPVLFFIRDRLMSDYTVWKRNSGGEIDLPWVKCTNDHGLFSLIDEHLSLATAKARSNWYSSFESSVDLKATVRNHLRLPQVEASLEVAIEQNRIPILDIEANIQDQSWGTPWEVSFVLRLRNVGTVPGLNIQLRHVRDDGSFIQTVLSRPVLAPAQVIEIYPFFNEEQFEGQGDEVKQRYQSEMYLPSGAIIRDIFCFTVSIRADSDDRGVGYVMQHISRKYLLPSKYEPVFEIERQ